MRRWVKTKQGKFSKFAPQPANWFIDNVKVADTLTSYKFPLDSAGTYKLKACSDVFYIIKNKAGVNIDTIAFTDTLEIFIYVIDKPIVKFDVQLGYNGEFGFHKYEHKEFNQISDSLKLEKIKIWNKDYYTPWLSLSEGQSATLIAKVSVPVIYPDLKIKFEVTDDKKLQLIGATEYDTTNLLKGVNEIPIIIKAKKNVTGFDKFCPILVKNENDSIIGKINVATEKINQFKKRHLTLIKVITDTTMRSDSIVLNDILSGTGLLGLEDFFEIQSYNQAFVKWDIELDSLNLVHKLDTNYINNVETDKTKSLSLLNKIKIEFVKNKGESIEQRFYVFVVDKKGAIFQGGKLNGMGRFPEQGKPNYAIIYYNAKNSYTTYVHELGHNHGLRHPFQQFPTIYKYSTYNIMDYGKIRYSFWYWQCKILYNFKFK